MSSGLLTKTPFSFSLFEANQWSLTCKCNKKFACVTIFLCLIRYDEDGEGRVVSEHLHTGLNQAEAESFKEEWSEGWRPAPENLQKHQLKPRGAEIPYEKTQERKHKKEV